MARLCADAKAPPQLEDIVIISTPNRSQQQATHRTTFKSHAQRTAEKQGDLKIDKNHVFEDSAPDTTSFTMKSTSLDSLRSILYSYITYTS
jgi:hypothetical protein